MSRYLNRAFEKLNSDRVMAGKAMQIARVEALIGSLRACATSSALIRIGGDSDGGYLLPDDLDGITAVVSPGTSTEIGFDLQMAEQGRQVYMADHSVEGPPIQHGNFHFSKKFLDVIDSDTTVRLDTLCSTIDHRHDGDRLLQMDIEGAEYRVLLDASEDTLRSFRIMAIEFHSLDRIFDRFAFDLIEATFRKLLKNHNIVHIHPNNAGKVFARKGISIPAVMEFTFYRKDRAPLVMDKKLTFPHLLDRDNVSQRPHIDLPKCWW